MRTLGRAFLGLLRYLGQLARLFSAVIESLRRGSIRWKLTGEQIVNIGYGSQLVVVVTGAFTGAVFTAQMYYQFVLMGVENAVGAIVSIAMCRELGPVLSALMITGRVGAAMTAEIGTMKVSEQIDALRGLAVHPVDYLVVPRFLGMMISMPLLIAEAIVFGIFASWVVACGMFGIPDAYYWSQVNYWTALEDIAFGVIKGFIFGIVIVVVACHRGLNTTDGAVGVGRSTTFAVVTASLCILILNFFLTILLTYFFPYG